MSNPINPSSSLPKQVLLNSVCPFSSFKRTKNFESITFCWKHIFCGFCLTTGHIKVSNTYLFCNNCNKVLLRSFTDFTDCTNSQNCNDYT